MNVVRGGSGQDAEFLLGTVSISGWDRKKKIEVCISLKEVRCRVWKHGLPQKHVPFQQRKGPWSGTFRAPESADSPVGPGEMYSVGQRMVLCSCPVD